MNLLVTHADHDIRRKARRAGAVSNPCRWSRGPTVTRLNAKLAAIIRQPAIDEKLRALGNVPSHSSPDQFKNLIATTVAKWNKVIGEAQIERI